MASNPKVCCSLHQDGSSSARRRMLQGLQICTFKDLIKLRNKIYTEWEKYENTPLKKLKNEKIRMENIEGLLITFYTCFPRSKNEELSLVIVKSEEEERTKEAAIYIKDKFTIMKLEKNHPKIKFQFK